MPSVTRHVGARLVAVVRADPAGFRVGFVALALAGITGLLAGLVLGAITDTLDELPGLLVLVPAAIAMRGSIFGALGSRLGTAIHTGGFRMSAGRDSLVGQNVAASLVLSVGLSAIVAVVAKAVSVAFGIAETISLSDFMVVSVVGGSVASIAVLAITVGVAGLSARRGYDLDNVAAPIVTSAGDVVTVPALFAATALTEIDVVTSLLAVLLAAAAALALVAGWRARREIARTIVRESLPVLVVAALISTIAGAAVERRTVFLSVPLLLVLLPPFLGVSGSLGGVLSARLGTKLHLGLLQPGRMRLASVLDDFLLVVIYAVPMFVGLGLLAELVATAGGLETPGLGDTIAVVLIAGALVTALTMVVGYLAAVLAHRLSVDPDNYGIPMVTAALDLCGAFALVIAVAILGLT